MNLRRINLNLLPFFEALYTERHLTAAAERLAVSQPTMSNALAKMRVIFKDQLFIKVGNTMEPTLKARRIAPGIISALDQVRGGVMDDEQFDFTVSRNFNLAGMDRLDAYVIPELIRRNVMHTGSIHFNSMSLSDKECI